MAKTNPGNLQYTKTHEWVKIENDVAVCGITDHAQEILSELTLIEFSDIGKKVKAGDSVVGLESSKSVSEVHAPVPGTILEINEQLKANPRLVNDDAFGAGWIIKIQMDSTPAPGVFMNAAEYTSYSKE